MSNVNNYLSRLMQCLKQVESERLDSVIDLIRASWLEQKNIICFGNGGSALTAQHYITDWNKSVYLKTGKPFNGHCLADNIGLFSAYANDISYDDVFVAQLRPLMKKGDLVIGISGSGNSKNVLKAIEYANENGAVTLGICGYDGGRLKSLVQRLVWVPINDMQITEDIHLIFGHMVMQALCSDNK